ncbi:cation:proton antiporter [Hyphococcus luteus]|uniref:Cation:proton antiporter n=1 Tax=Hyphococcus luteus TaxID=2058213 RepID=A0A2S7KAM5_9PROT|nr:cation:proton antiporter [Marinicaulis flavus]PQA89574.1 cation:proton antiporter [Marinicaulis flavus]
MTELHGEASIVLLLLGAIIVSSVIIRRSFERIHMPPIVGYTMLGLLISTLDPSADFISVDARRTIGVFANIGLVALLFRVGLESNLAALVQQLRPALMVWVSDITVSALTAFAVVRYVFDFGLIPAILSGAAFSATSVGVSTAVWRDAKALKRPSGALLIDVAELDDISAVIIISILFALGPLIGGGAGGSLAPLLAHQTALVLINLALFATGCIVFSRFIEKRVTKRFAQLDPKYGPAFFAAGAAFAIAAAADLLGLSLAIGAMFAGLAFSRDPVERKIDQSFSPIYDFFAPFFFVHIGMGVEIQYIFSALGFGIILFAAASLGKIVGVGLPSLRFIRPRGALLIGVSMIPRAEIALLVMGYGLSLGDWATPPALYNTVVLVSLATCILSPIAVRWLLQTSPPLERKALT